MFLNNDTTVQPDWLAPLVRLADADPLVGLVGVKLLNNDGTVQEAGGAILRNGWGLPYGAGRNPAAPELNFVRDVDVAVGACILVRRDAFEQAGGFDERYAPAFYEEFDLAFTLRSRGWRVVYQPASVVVHHGSNSYGTEARDRHSQANHAKFCVKWARALLGQPLPNAPELQIRSRPAPAGTVLVIDDRVPEWDRNAGGVTLNQYLHLLQRMGYQVVFCPAYDATPTQPYTAILQQDGIEILHAPEALERWMKANGRQLDLVWTARPDVTGPILELIRAETRAPILYYTHDLHHLRERRRWELEGDPHALVESKRLKRVEDRIFARVDHVMTPSADEAAVIRADVPAARVHVIPPYLVPATPLAIAGRDFADRGALIFVGGYNHAPNVDAAVWLVREIMPLVWSALPDVRLLLVGNAPTPAVMDLAGRRVTVTGFVPDIAPLYAQSRLSVNALRYGAGVKGKIVASLQEGVPVITTPVGNEGLGLAHGKEAWVAENAADLAAGIVELYQDPARCAAMAQAAQAVLRRDFSEDAARAAMMGVLGQWTCRVCGRSALRRTAVCPHCDAGAAALGMASVILQGLPGNGRSLADMQPRLSRLSIRICDDVPAALQERLRRSSRTASLAERTPSTCWSAVHVPRPRGLRSRRCAPADAGFRPGGVADADALITAGFDRRWPMRATVAPLTPGHAHDDECDRGPAVHHGNRISSHSSLRGAPATRQSRAAHTDFGLYGPGLPRRSRLRSSAPSVLAMTSLLRTDAGPAKWNSPVPSVLVDLRPCYEGFAGIPQETRLLFQMFSEMGLARLGGLASGIHFAGPPRRRKRAPPCQTPFDRTLEQARVLISQDTKRHHAPPGLSFLLPGPIRRRMHHVTTILSLAQTRGAGRPPHRSRSCSRTICG